MLGGRQSRRRRPTVTARSEDRHSGVTTRHRPDDQRLMGSGTIACPEPARADCPARPDRRRVRRGRPGPPRRHRSTMPRRAWEGGPGECDRVADAAMQRRDHAQAVGPGRTYHLRLTGAFALRCVDEPIPLPINSQRLIAYLALSDGPTQRSHVAGTFWPDVGQDRAMANLRSVIWRVRGSGHELIAADDGQLSLQRNVIVDARELRRTAYAILESGDGRRSHWLDALVRSDEILPDWSDEWVLVDRERYHQLRLHALERLCGLPGGHRPVRARGRSLSCRPGCRAVAGKRATTAHRGLPVGGQPGGCPPSVHVLPARHPRGGRRGAVARDRRAGQSVDRRPTRPGLTARRRGSGGP